MLSPSSSPKQMWCFLAGRGDRVREGPQLLPDASERGKVSITWSQARTLGRRGREESLPCHDLS